MRTGDILVTTASEVPDECAITSVVEDTIEANIFLDDHLFGLHLKDDLARFINTTYVNYYMNTANFKKDVRRRVKGVTRFFVSPNDIGSIKIPVPPLEIQREIVRILDQFTELTDKLNAELAAELAARKKQYEYYRDKLLSFDILGTTGGVVWRTIGEIADISRGKVISKVDIRDNPGEYPVYSSQTENDGELGKIDTYMFDGEYLTWTTDGAKAGTVFYRKGRFNITNVCGLLKVSSDYTDIRYLYHLLSAVAPSYVSPGMGNAKLMSNVMGSIRIVLPPLSEQRRIAAILDRFDTLCNDLTSGLPAEIEARQRQYEYYRDKLLSFPVTSSAQPA